MNFNELFPLQVYINLDSRPDRNQQFKDEISKFDFHPIRKPGVVPLDIKNTWQRGTMGCLISHLQVLQAAWSLQTNVFVFEDDLLFINNDKIEEVINGASQELTHMEWDFFYIAGNILKKFTRTSTYLARLNHIQSTVGYGVNYKFIPKIFDAIDMNNIDRPIDVYYSDMASKHNFFITVPMLAIQRDSYSDIEGQNVNYSSYLEKRYWENFVE